LHFLDYKIFQNTASDYLLSLLILFVSFAVIKIIEVAVLRRLTLWALKTETQMDDRLVKTINKRLVPIAYVAAFTFALKNLVLSPVVEKIFNVCLAAFVTAMVAGVLSSMVRFFLEKHWEKRGEDSENAMPVKWVAGLFRILIWIIAGILFLENIGFEINSLLAGLGIGGIALAFAAQAILGDVFCFFTILFDRPFEIGDYITVGEQGGTVEHVGVKTTRLRALSGEQLIFSNTDLTGSRIRNYKTMEQRRVLFRLNVTYDTDTELLKQIPQLIKNIIESLPETQFARAHFVEFAPSSLDYEIAYFVLHSDYDKYLDIHQEVNLRIKEEFQKRGIEFAFPTQTIHMETLQKL